MSYEPINLKHIRVKIFDDTQENFSDALGIKYRTYQNYEGEQGIPPSKLPMMKEKIAQYASSKGVVINFEDLPVMESAEKKELKDYTDLEIIEYIANNRERFLELKMFRIVVGLTRVDELEKKMKIIEEKVKFNS